MSFLIYTTKAIIVMHYAGFPCNMDEIMRIAKKYNYQTKFIDLGAKMNLQVTDWIRNKITTFIDKKKKTKCLILGVTYKADINDIRESPSLKIIKKLMNLKNCQVDFMDPYVQNIRINNLILENTKVENFGKYDLTILCTDHYKFNYKNSKNSLKIFKSNNFFGALVFINILIGKIF